MGHERLGLDIYGANGVLRLVRHVVNHDTGEVGAAPVVLGVEDQGGAATPRLSGGGGGAEASGALALDGAHGRVGHDVAAAGVLGVVQPRQGLGQVLGVDLLVGGALAALLPVVGRGGRGANEEELAGVREGEVGVGRGVEGRVLAKVDAAALTHDRLAVPDRADGDGVGLGIEGDEDATEGLERRPSMNRRGLEDQVLDGFEVIGAEDREVLQVGDEEGVGCRGGLLYWWQVGEVKGEGHPGGAAGLARKGLWPALW